MDAKSSLACALRGKPCKQGVRLVENARVLADACPYPRPEGYAGELVTLENYWWLKGTPPPPLCEGCPVRNDPKQPIRRITVVHTYRTDDVAADDAA